MTSEQILFTFIFIWFILITIWVTNANSNRKEEVKKLKKEIEGLKYDITFEEVFKNKTTPIVKEERIKLLVVANRAASVLRDTDKDHIAKNLERFKRIATEENSDRAYSKLKSYEKYLIKHNIIKDYYD